MKKLNFAIILCAIISLSGCSGNSENNTMSYEKVNTFFGNISYVNTDVFVNTATNDDNICYRLSYTKDGAEETICVVEPESISGIEIPLKDGEVCLSDDGTSVASSVDTESSVTPINVIPYVINCLSNYIPTDIGSEKINDSQSAVFTYDVSSGNIDYTQRIWLDNSSMYPLKSQTYLDGTCIIECTFNEFDCRQKD